MSNVLALFSALLDQWFYFRRVGATQETRGINVFDVSYVCYINEDFEAGDTVCHAFTGRGLLFVVIVGPGQCMSRLKITQGNTLEVLGNEHSTR